MSKKQLKKQLEIVNNKIDQRIIAGKNYKDLAKQHKNIINALKHN